MTMSDDFKRHIAGYRGRSSGRRGSIGGPCPCCVETSSKRGRSRMARARVNADDRAGFAEGIEVAEENARDAEKNCTDPDHCCECGGEFAECDGCYFCERGK